MQTIVRVIQVYEIARLPTDATIMSAAAATTTTSEVLSLAAIIMAGTTIMVITIMITVLTYVEPFWRASE